VADQRTSSVIVSAARDLMGQIGEMINQLDSNPARKQKVFVYDLENADPTQVQEVLNNLFVNQQTSRNQRSTTTQNSALSTRQTQNTQNSTGRTGTSGFGSGAGGGGGGGGGGFGRGN
jgi:type II secretory pathway component GspD/PulD (secretin)